MSETEDARLGIGGNNPPQPLKPDEVRAYLVDTTVALSERRDALLQAVERFKASTPVIEDEETQGKAGDFLKQLAAAIKQLEDKRVSAKQPFLDAGRAVDAFFKGLVEPLQAGSADVRRPMTAYATAQEAAERARRAEAARVAAEASARAQAALMEQQQREREAAAAAIAARAALHPDPPPAPPMPRVTIEDAVAAAEAAQKAEREANARSADLSRTRGDMGSVNSLREVWDMELMDLEQVPLRYLQLNESAVRAAIRGGAREIPGIRVFMTKHLVTR